MPFDKFCPSVSPIVGSRTCAVCKQYFPSKKALNDHKKAKFCGNYTLHEDFGNLTDSDDEMEITHPIHHTNDTRWPIINEQTDEFAVRFEEIATD